MYTDISSANMCRDIINKINTSFPWYCWHNSNVFVFWFLLSRIFKKKHKKREGNIYKIITRGLLLYRRTCLNFWERNFIRNQSVINIIVIDWECLSSICCFQCERWKKKKKKTCTFAGEKFNRWCSLNADSRWQLDSCQTRGKISTRMESGSCWKLRKLGILFTRQTAFGSFRPSCTRSPAQTRLLNIPFVFVRQLCPRQFCRQVVFFFL